MTATAINCKDVFSGSLPQVVSITFCSKYLISVMGNSMVTDVHFRQFCAIFSHKFINIYNSKSVSTVLSCLQVALLSRDSERVL